MTALGIQRNNSVGLICTLIVIMLPINRNAPSDSNCHGGAQTHQSMWGWQLGPAGPRAVKGIYHYRMDKSNRQTFKIPILQ